MRGFVPFPKEGALKSSDGFEDPFRGGQDREQVERHCLKRRFDKDESFSEIQSAQGPV